MYFLFSILALQRSSFHGLLVRSFPLTLGYYDLLLTSCHSLLLPLSELTRPPRVRVHSFTSCNCRLYIRRFRLVFGLRIILHSHPLRLPIDDFCSSSSRFCYLLLSACTSLHTTFADSLALPTSGRARDFHPLDCTHAEHKNKPLAKEGSLIEQNIPALRAGMFLFVASSIVFLACLFQSACLPRIAEQ